MVRTGVTAPRNLQAQYGSRLQVERRELAVEEFRARRRMVETARLRGFPYFHGPLERHNHDFLLPDQGDFLVFTSRHSFAVAVRWAGKLTYHTCLVNAKHEVNYYAFTPEGVKGVKCLSVQDLVEHYRKTGIPLPGGERLETPVPRSRWDLSGSDVQVGPPFKADEFARVYRGTYGGKDVALRLCIDLTPESQAMFEKEAMFALQFKHKNVMKVLGVVLTLDVRMTVMELLDGGTLQSHLKKEKSTAASLQGFCLDVAQGMEYLERIDYVHRNLNTANCLMGPKQEVKIAGLGISESTNGIPLAGWGAPEYSFSHKSDVWAFGILVWVVFSGGKDPYPGIAHKDLPDEVKRGRRMSPPADTPRPLVLAMRQCWEMFPRDRPTFAKLVAGLEGPATRAPASSARTALAAPATRAPPAASTRSGPPAPSTRPDDRTTRSVVPPTAK